MSFSGQSNAAPWQQRNVNVNVMSSFHQGQSRPPPQQMFLQQPPQQANMAFHGSLQAGGIFPPGGGAVSYPQPRSTGLNPVAFQQVAGGGGGGGGGGQSQHYNSIGTVTKINSDCGLVNNEVFFYRNVCKGHAPKLGDRVLFEATYSSSGQFKWNATRIQLMPQQSHQPPPLMGTNVGAGNVSNKSGSGYNAVPPPNEYRGPPQHHRHNSPRRSSPGRDRHARNDREHRDRERTHRSRDRDDDEHDRKRRREDRSRERISSTSRSGATAVVRSERGAADRERDAKLDRKDRERQRESERERDREREREKERSPHRAIIKGRRTRTIRRYMVQIPKSILAYKHADVQELRQRYNTLYIPSDFFHANVKWSESFTLENPFPLSRPCQFHIMHKIVEPPIEEETEENEPADADYLYSAKVMLMSCPPIAEIYQKCFDDDDTDNEQHTVHPSRLIGFLVGTRGRNEPMAIGGPWSPSLDGENPDKDPAVLIRTAIRTCKALTGIDLSNCTQWYRFKELFYHRTDNKNKDAPPRIETVVIYLPDVHSCMPSPTAWQNLTQSYKTAVENVIARRTAACKASVAVAADDNSPSGAATLANNTSNADNEGEADADIDGDGEGEGDGEAEVAAEAEVGQAETDDGGDDDDVTIIEEADDQKASSSAKEGAAAADDGVAESTKDVSAEGDENETEKDDSPEPTHYSQLDLKTMKVPEIRNELIARNLPSKGVRNLIMARLAKAINAEKSDEVNSKKASVKKTKPIANKVEEMEVDADTKKADETETPAEEQHAEQADGDNEANENENEDNEDWTDVIDVDMSDIVILDEYDSSKNPEEIPKEMDEKEKSQLIRRYTLPSAPHVIVHPNKTAKGGKFDCSVMSLSVLLDYRPEDTKERFFEVSLFAELFNEMLMRDFGFNIYKELYVYKESVNAGESAASDSKNEDANNKKDEAGAVAEDEEKTKESTENKSNSDEASEKSARGRRTSKRSVDDEPDDDNQSAKSSADRKRKSTASTSGRDKDKDANADKKMVVVKPQLLLSFVYFDTTHCGYIFEKDLEDLFSILGLNLSRGQIRKVLGKLATRQAFYYRKLTDKEETLETIPTIEDADDIPIDELKKIALGNRQFDAVFNKNSSSETGVSPTSDENDGFINHNGAVIHVGKLVAQIKRTEKNYSDLEKLYNDIRKQHTDLQKDHSKSSGKIKDLQSEVKSLNRKLSDTDQGLSSINRKYRDQQSTLSYIYNRVAPYFNREKDKDHKSEGGRADKDSDKEKHKDKDGKDSKEGKDSKDSKDKERNRDKESKDEERNRKNGEKDKTTDEEKVESKSEVKDADNKKIDDENSKDGIKEE